MDGYEKFEREVYPRLWHLAYDAGVKAREDGSPRVCNLEGSPHCHNGNVLKVYKSAWEQGDHNMGNSTIDMDWGRFSIDCRGGGAGHTGLKNLLVELAQDYIRLRKKYEPD